ncbi:PH domain-containing protein [Nocardia terpenica]|uniref:YdbS-like PH domain-containing protein n=1 Tax=Nocardia terpenica TaxID=455432 RepID=A0A161XDM2_9NOCA|nr:PH domain-containing protein [Nocardia terpenica]KZM71398.1 hypothetical protein AWN90_01095 [Nocardia terpenica]
MTAWRRLDRRMLLIHPVKELVRYIPVLIVAVIAGTRSDNPGWSLIALVAIVGLAVAQWFTTTYRIGPDTVELRRGLLQRKTLTVPRSRIRSVDVHADLLHRLLGLVVLAIGTGQHAGKEERFHLDGVSAAQVPELRALLLSGHPETEAGQADSPAEAPARGPEIGRWRPQWVRYAPLSLTGLAVIGPAVGVAAKFGVAGAVADSETVRGIGRHSALYITLVVLAAIVVIALAVAVFDCLRYLTTYFGLTVTVEGSTLRLRHGLLTTRQTDLDLSRLRGATVKEPLLLRLAGGAVVVAVVLVGAVGLARDRYRGLGHAVLPAAGARPAWLITRHGSLERDRDCLEAPGIIGWTVRQTLFQRRAGLATVVAATAAGKKRYHVIDVPLEQAWDLIDAVTPGRLGHRAPAEPTLR